MWVGQRTGCGQGKQEAELEDWQEAEEGAGGTATPLGASGRRQAGPGVQQSEVGVQELGSRARRAGAETGGLK